MTPDEKSGVISFRAVPGDKLSQGGSCHKTS